MPTSIDDIELRSEQVQQILKRPPSSLVRWGTAVIFLALAMALTISLFVHYPSKVAGTIALLPANTGSVYGEMRIMQDAVKYIQPGQAVQIRFDLYPVEDFGIVTGIVNDIATTINSDKTVSVRVSVHNPPLASMALKSGMTGHADIITGDQSVAKKLFGLLQ
jgi:hypothetical protein